MGQFLHPSDRKSRGPHGIDDWASLVLCRLDWQGSWEKGAYTRVVQRSSSTQVVQQPNLTLVHPHTRRMKAWGCGIVDRDKGLELYIHLEVTR